MSPRSEEQFKEIRKEKSLLILNTALKLFADNGYHSTSISKIASSAKISKGLIYNYFNSKEDILARIIDLGFDKIFENFDPNNDGSLEIEEMKFYIETLFQSLKENREFWKFYFQVSIQSDAQVLIKKKVEQLLGHIMGIMINYFETIGYDDPKTEAIIFGALMDGIALDYVLQPDLLPLDKIKENLITKYCNITQNDTRN